MSSVGVGKVIYAVRMEVHGQAPYEALDKLWAEMAAKMPAGITGPLTKELIKDEPTQGWVTLMLEGLGPEGLQMPDGVQWDVVTPGNGSQGLQEAYTAGNGHQGKWVCPQCEAYRPAPGPGLDMPQCPQCHSFALPVPEVEPGGPYADVPPGHYVVEDPDYGEVLVKKPEPEPEPEVVPEPEAPVAWTPIRQIVLSPDLRLWLVGVDGRVEAETSLEEVRSWTTYGDAKPVTVGEALVFPPPGVDAETRWEMRRKTWPEMAKLSRCTCKGTKPGHEHYARCLLVRLNAAGYGPDLGG